MDSTCTQERLGDNDAGYNWGEDKISRPVWKDNVGKYLRGIRGGGSSVTEKRKRPPIKEKGNWLLQPGRLLKSSWIRAYSDSPVCTHHTARIPFLPSY